MDNHNLALKLFEEVIDQEMLLEMKTKGVIECKEGFKCASVAVLDLALEEPLKAIQKEAAKTNVKSLDDMCALSDRFELVDSEAIPPILDIKLDGVSISIADLIGVENKIASELVQNGVSIKIVGKTH